MVLYLITEDKLGILGMAGCPLISPSTEVYRLKKRSSLLGMYTWRTLYAFHKTFYGICVGKYRKGCGIIVYKMSIQKSKLQKNQTIIQICSNQGNLNILLY